jgi:insertion element IS1 protein InsB
VSGDRVEAAEGDDRWSFMGKKPEPRGLGPASEHGTGKVLAYVFGRRRAEGFLQRKALREPFGIARFFPAHWGAYARPLAPAVQVPGNRKTQQIERKHLTVRTRGKRLARKPICCSKSAELHASVMGLFVNRYEFGLPV